MVNGRQSFAGFSVFALILLVGLMAALPPRSIMADDGLSITGMSAPALPSEWTRGEVQLVSGTQGIAISDGVPLRAYGRVTPFLTLIGHVIAPKDAAQNSIVYVYASSDIAAADMGVANAKDVADSAVVFSDNQGGYTGYFISPDNVSAIASAAPKKEVIDAFLHSAASKAAEADGQEGEGYFATANRLKGVPVRARLAVNTDTWTLATNAPAAGLK